MNKGIKKEKSKNIKQKTMSEQDKFQLVVNENWCHINNINNHDEKNDDAQKITEKRFKFLEERIKKMEEKMQEIQTEHLKTMNKLLETEISLERTKNLLVRNHIPFPFSASSICKEILTKRL